MGHDSLAAVVGGLGGALAISAGLFAARMLGLTDMNLALLNGTLITANPSTAAWTLGFGMHLLAGILFALVYLAIFGVLGRCGWASGAAIGLVHGLLSGLLMAMLPRFHPLMSPGVSAPMLSPGFLGIRYGGITAVSFVLLHVVFGAIVGATCHRFGSGMARR